MKILKTKKFTIHIYIDDHPPPHCHVRFKETEISVDLPLIAPRYGATISKDVKEFIEQNLDEICDEFDRMHPPRKLKSKK
ncbi:MAG: DUF4160 domain-containing protein [Ignavibacteria bacterium]